MPSNGSDNFDRADGDLGVNWSIQASTFAGTILSNRVRSAGGSVEQQFTFLTPGNDQSARIQIPTLSGPSDGELGVLLRCATPGTRSFYRLLAFRGIGSSIGLRLAGANTDLASEGTTTWAPGDGLEGRVVGNVLTVYRYVGNTGSGTAVLTYTDAANTLTAGGVGIRIGIGTGGAVGDVELDNFVGGTYPPPAGGGITPQLMASYARRRRT